MKRVMREFRHPVTRGEASISAFQRADEYVVIFRDGTEGTAPPTISTGSIEDARAAWAYYQTRLIRAGYVVA